MQQFTVPQFIDVEDKIIGPITARQFVIMLAGLLLAALSYKLFTFNFFIFSGSVIMCTSGVFAFFKINGMPFQFFVLNFIQTVRRPGLRVWNNRLVDEIIIEETDKQSPDDVRVPPKQKVTSSRLAELALIVDTQGVYRGEADDSTELKEVESPAEKIIKDFAI